MPLSPLRPGDPATIGGFRLVARLGSGGMGVVYVGTDQAGRPAAVKSVKAEYAADPAFRARFRREVAAARAVTGACTARVLDAGPDAAEPWLATEYVGGASLDDVVRADGPFSDQLLHALATGLAEALSAIHEAGVVHRDLKPANVLLAPDGPKVIDFGIAAMESATHATRTGVGMGSPGYMAPEQVTGTTLVGPPADVYGWGLTVLFAATAKPPYGSGPAPALMYRVVHAEVDLSGLPQWIAPLVQAALDREPQNRPTAKQLLQGLVAFGQKQNQQTMDGRGATAVIGQLGGWDSDERAATRPFDTDATQLILREEWQQPAAARAPELPSPPVVADLAPGNRRGETPKSAEHRSGRTALVTTGVLTFLLAAALTWFLWLGPDRRANDPAETARPQSSTSAGPTATTPATTTTPAITAPAGTGIPLFQGDLGDPERSAAFSGLVSAFNGQVVQLSSQTAATAQTERYFQANSPGGEEYDDPQFTLFAGTGLAEGQEPGFPPGSPCTATTYSVEEVDGEDPGDARFVHDQNGFLLSGYFEVDIEDTENGVTTVTLSGLNEQDVLNGED
ncbi:hypothetical protein Kisp01_72300 [Kineosporia sp. NBRC 101677]|uniref:serine/threonine-protein kinase n=1 Tax=Kineosporia sp. NBRC 101677 TaxID=3032197 RepID=UPI0024A57330|nr:serine/threonine-protein kinase [Kineosporia sp. NBRC 101677]GLY20216.1 hypothetical protein Kisp01_72300 [Kineosporia sp. NBRC 101677]